MITQEDIYSKPTDPTTTINPKIVGAFYINTKTAKLFVCTDNTINKNVWKMCNPDVVMPDIPDIPSTFTGTLVDCTNSRRNNVWYRNTYNKPIFVMLNRYADSHNYFYIKVNNKEISFYSAGEGGHDDGPGGLYPIPSNAEYKTTASWTLWYEFR